MFRSSFFFGVFVGALLSALGFLSMTWANEFQTGRCASEAQTYCAIYGFKGSKLKKCLLDNQNRLTPGCVESQEFKSLLVERAKGKFRPKITRGCLNEAKRVCRSYGKRLTSKTIQACLDKAEIGVSLKCREQLDRWVVSSRSTE